MKFSERYGYLKPSEVIIREQITSEIQNAICNCYDDLEENLRLISSINENLYEELEKHIWTSFHNFKKSEYKAFSQICLNILESNEFEWYRKLDFIEETIIILRKYISHFDIESNFIDVLNSEFERLNFGYRIIENVIVEITSSQEINSIETAIENNKDNVRLHLNNALKLLAQRPESDYRNSIKESISAVEAYTREITGDKGLNLAKMESAGFKISPVLRKSFEIMYGYANDPATGIRHALMDETAEYIPGAEEALFMLVSCSAFINYLNRKKAEAE
jgi:hypothetical protein